ncbi:MAG: DinB family protein [Chloroflexi bacterium]|nr:DinB family protein [Chloroflexota bacterium]
MPKISKITQVETARQFAFLQRMSMAHDRSIRSISGLTEVQLCTEPVTGDWTVKDMLGHVVTWNDEFRLAIQNILKKEISRFVSQEVDWEAWNAEKISGKRKWPWKRIRADLERDYSEAIELIVHLRPEEFRKYGATPWVYSPPKEMAKFINGSAETVETLVTYHWRHMNQHSRMIEKWGEKRGFKE